MSNRQLRHINAAGACGGNALCGAHYGVVVCDEANANCPACIAEMDRQQQQQLLRIEANLS